MEGYNQTVLFPEMEVGAVVGPVGFDVDPEQIVDSPEKAVALLGREIGRIGTILSRLSEREAIGRFSLLYGQHITRYIDILVKKKELEKQAGGDLERILEGVYRELNDSYNLAGTDQAL